MFDNHGMYDEDIVESAEQVAAGELILSLDDLEFLLNRAVDLSLRQKLEDRLIFGVFEKMLSTADLDDDSEMEQILDAALRIQKGEMDEPLHALDMIAESGVSFMEQRYCSGSLTTLRDWFLGWKPDIMMLEKMKSMGIDLDTPLVKGRTPAFLVASKEYHKKSAFDKKDPEEELAKAMACFSRESMEALDDKGISAAHEAAKNNHARMMEVMIRAGINVNLTEDAPQVAGTTLLHTACRYGNPEVVKLLIEAGADDTMLNAKEESPAHVALFHNYITGSKRLEPEDRIELIRELKHVDVPGRYGMTPMMAALECQDYGISHCLAPVFIEKGADVNHSDDLGNTPLLLAGGMDILKALVEAGADVNARNRNGDTPLHKALMRQSSREARYLIKKGADVGAVNEEQVTPMQLAVENGFEELLPLMGL